VEKFPVNDADEPTNGKTRNRCEYTVGKTQPSATLTLAHLCSRPDKIRAPSFDAYGVPAHRTRTGASLAAI